MQRACLRTEHQCSDELTQRADAIISEGYFEYSAGKLASEAVCLLSPERGEPCLHGPTFSMCWRACEA